MRLRVPTFMASRVSRASSLWPTSSKASVESWPATSRRTSSPPLVDHRWVSASVPEREGRCGEARWHVGDATRRKKEGSRQNLRMLVNKFGGIVDDVVDDEVQILLGVVLGNVLVGELLRHLDGCVRVFGETEILEWPAVS